MAGIFYLADLQKYICIGVHHLNDGIEDTIQTFSLYILVDTLTDVHRSHKTKDIHHDYLFVQSFPGIDHHVYQHIDGL
jgi:hypothetical protein